MPGLWSQMQEQYLDGACIQRDGSVCVLDKAYEGCKALSGWVNTEKVSVPVL